MPNLIVEDLIARLHKAVDLLGVQSMVHSIFYDTVEDIVTIQLFMGVDKVDFYTSIEKLGILKKDDQLAINWI